MPLRDRSLPLILALIGALALSVGAGCFGQSRLDKAIVQAGMSKETVYPLAGKVTVDWLPPALERRETLVAMLNDPQKLDRPVPEKAYTVVDPKTGAFAFTTYASRDGIKAGNYILTFAVLSSKGKIGLVGPDKLNNLYNDPDKNSHIPEFKIDHKAPGKKNYSFNLEVAGKETVESGPHAVTRLTYDSR